MNDSWRLFGSVLRAAFPLRQPPEAQALDLVEVTRHATPDGRPWPHEGPPPDYPPTDPRNFY